MVRSDVVVSVLMFVKVVGVSSASAQPLTVANAGFEAIVGSTQIYNEFSFGPPPGWSLYDPELITGNGDGPIYYVGTLTPQPDLQTPDPSDFINFPAGAPEGQRVAILFNFEGTGDEGEYGIEQTLTDTLQPNTQYTLEVEVGNIASGLAVDMTFYDLRGFPGYRVELLAGGQVLVADDSSLTGSMPEGQFATSMLTYTTGPAPDPVPLGIRLISLNQADPSFPQADIEVDFDDVRLTATPADSAAPLLVAVASRKVHN